MNAFALTTFPFVTAQIRACLIDGQCWFVARDVFSAIDLAWRGKESIAKIKAEWKGVRNFRTPSETETGRGGGEQELLIITEPAVYKIAFRSDKPEAERFTDRVAEIVSEIRKTGAYSLPQPRANTISNAQYSQLAMAVRDACVGWAFHGAEPWVYNLLRVRFSLHNIKDLPAENLDDALAIVAGAQEMNRDLLGYLTGMLDTYYRDYLGAGVPLTMVVKRDWNKKMPLALPARPDWVAVQRQLLDRPQ